MRFNEKLITLRKRKGLSQEEFSYEMGVSRQSVFKWESGENTPDVEKIKKIAKFYSISLDVLLDDNLELDESVVFINKAEETKSEKTHETKPFCFESKIRENRSLITIGILLIIISFFIVVISFWVLESLIFKFIVMGIFIFVGSFGLTLLFLSVVTRNDYILVTNENITGRSFGKKFAISYGDIKNARILNRAFSSIAILINNDRKERVVWRLKDPDTVVKLINSTIKKESTL